MNPDEEHNRSEGQGSDQHEIERAVARLNQWFAEHEARVPPRLNWSCFRRERCLPVFEAVQTTALKGWRVEDLKRLYRVVAHETRSAARRQEVPVEVLVADKSLSGEFLDVEELMRAAMTILADGLWLGRFSPRLWWFWLNYPSFIVEIASYVQGIRLRVDAKTAVKHDQRRVFEEFNVPLENGQQTAIGKGCLFVLDYAEPHGAVPYWRFSVTRDNEVVVGPQVLQTKPIYLDDQLLAVIKKISETGVILSVLTSEGGNDAA